MKLKITNNIITFSDKYFVEHIHSEKPLSIKKVCQFMIIRYVICGKSPENILIATYVNGCLNVLVIEKTSHYMLHI